MICFIINEMNKFKKANKWEVREPDTMLDVLYDRMAYGVGCFVFEKGRENEKG